MIKFFTVLSGIFFLATGLWAGLFALVILFFPRQDPMPLSTQDWLMVMFLAVMILWMIGVSIGLFVRKNWARVGVLIISCFALMVGLSMASVLIFCHMSHMQSGLPSQGVLSWLFLIAIPLFFLVFFNAQPVKALFIRKSGNTDVTKN